MLYEYCLFYETVQSMSDILEKAIDNRLFSITESQEAKDPYSPGYSRQYAEDMLWHTVGPLMDQPRWVNKRWDSPEPEPEGYTPGGPAYQWTPEEVTFAFAGNPSKLFRGGNDSPNSGRMGGSPMFRAARKVARKFGKESDRDFISDLYSNGFVPLVKMMHKGFDEGREPFISYVSRSVTGAMEAGPGADKASIQVTSGEKSKEHFGLVAALSSSNPRDVRKGADRVRGEYRSAKSHDRHPDNPYGAYSYDYYTSMHRYADALESGDQESIEQSRQEIRDLIDAIEHSNPSIRGAASGMGQAVSNKDRGAASGEARFLTQALGLETIANSDRPDTFEKLEKRLNIINKNIQILDNKIAKEKNPEEKNRLAGYKESISGFVDAVIGNDKAATDEFRTKILSQRQVHLDDKKFGIASMDAQADDEASNMGSNMSSEDHLESWLDPEAVRYILEIAMNYDIGSILSKSSKWSKMAAELGAKGGKLGGKLGVNELRYLIRSMGPIGSNYPGAGKMRSNLSAPRDTKNWWQPGEDPEIEAIPSGGVWNSIWKRNGYSPMQPTAIVAEMTAEVAEFEKLGIPTGREVKNKVRNDGSVKPVEVISKAYVAATFKSAKIKLQIIADIHRDQLGLNESAGDDIPRGLLTNEIDRTIIAEHADRMAAILGKSLLLESVSAVCESVLMEIRKHQQQILVG
jgi:hypothetical protein